MRPAPQTTMVPAAALLSTWQAHGWNDGVSLDGLAALDRVRVTTRHNVYDIIVRSPSTGEVLVRGGQFFPEFTAARLAGSTLGGSFVKVRSLHVGFRLEFTLGQQFVLTSVVQAIAVIGPTQE